MTLKIMMTMFLKVFQVWKLCLFSIFSTHVFTCCFRVFTNNKLNREFSDNLKYLTQLKSLFVFDCFFFVCVCLSLSLDSMGFSSLSKELFNGLSNLIHLFIVLIFFLVHFKTFCLGLSNPMELDYFLLICLMVLLF